MTRRVFGTRTSANVKLMKVLPGGGGGGGLFTYLESRCEFVCFWRSTLLLFIKRIFCSAPRSIFVSGSI